MSNRVTEITEEVKTQIEIIESGSNQIELTLPEDTSIDISEPSSSFSTDLDITTDTEIITVDNVSDDTIINVEGNDNTAVDVIVEQTFVDVHDKLLLSGAIDFTFANIIDNPFNVTQNSTRIGTRGVTSPDFELQVSGTLFSDIISSSDLQLFSDGTNDIVTITSQSTTPVMINPAGVITLDNFQYTPTPVEGGLLYSGSDFYLGLE